MLPGPACLCSGSAGHLACGPWVEVEARLSRSDSAPDACLLIFFFWLETRQPVGAVVLTVVKEESKKHETGERGRRSHKKCGREHVQKEIDEGAKKSRSVILQV